MIDAVSDDKNSWDSGDELYLGAHMINDANHGDHTTVLKKDNSEIYSRYEIILTSEIKKGDEITFDYNKKVTTKRGRKGIKNQMLYCLTRKVKVIVEMQMIYAVTHYSTKDKKRTL